MMKFENLKENDIVVNSDGVLGVIDAPGKVKTTAGNTFDVDEFNPAFCLRYDNGVNIEKSVESVEGLPEIQIGDRGLAVGICQLCLNYKNYYEKRDSKNIDFDFGLKTHQALYNFIKDNYLTTETKTTPEVWKCLLKEL